MAPRPVQVRSNSRRPVLASSSSGGEDDGSGEEDAVLELNTWESDAEDDESREEPDVQDGDNENFAGDRELNGLSWEDVGELTTDPRARTGAMPDDIIPAFNMANYRQENYLNWFLHYFPLNVVTLLVNATNGQAKKIAWPVGSPWAHLKTGEFLRWLGLWILMTVYPTPGSCRRSYWRGILNFGQYMSEKRFEAILRAFTLPQYDRADPKWGGPGREAYERKRFDPFFETIYTCRKCSRPKIRAS